MRRDRVDWVAAVLLISAFSASVVEGQPDSEQPERAPPVEFAGGIVAVVGDDVITQAELDRQMEQRRDEWLQVYPPGVIDREWQRFMRLELEQMIDDKLVLQLVKKEEEKSGRPFIVDEQIDDQVEERVEDLRGRGIRLNSPDELYSLYFERFRMPRDEVRSHLKDQMSIVSYFWQKVFNGTSNFVSPQEVRFYYRDHIEEFSTPVEVSFRMIVISRSRSDFPLAVENVERGIAAGEDFVTLARRYSDATAIDGRPERAAKIWKRTFEELKPWSDEIRDALRTMRKGEVSRRLETPETVHYFKIEDLVSGEPKSFPEVQREIKQRVLMERRKQAQREFLDTLRRKAHIEILLPPLRNGSRTAGTEDRSSRRSDFKGEK